MTTGDTLKTVLRRASAHAAAPVWRRLRPRMQTIATDAATAAGTNAIEHTERLLQPLRDQLAHLRAENNDLRRDLDALRDRVDTSEHHTKHMPEQIAAVEVRLADLEATGRVAEPGQGEPTGEPRALLTEIRTEHRRIRARLAALASYEERLGRLENTIATTLAQPDTAAADTPRSHDHAPHSGSIR